MENFFLKRAFIIGLCSFVLFTSCKNETEIVSPNTKPTRENFQALRQSALDDITQVETFKVEDGFNFISKNGAKIYIAENCITTKDGTPVLGDVKFSFIEMYDRGNMVLTNKPLMGKDNNGNLLPLVTGGQFFIKVTQGANELVSGCKFFVTVPYHLTGSYDPNMLLWEGAINDQGNLAWTQNTDAMEGNLGLDQTETAYGFLWGSFGWTNIDRFYIDSRPKTQIKVTVPDGYSDQNSSVYIVFEDHPNALALLDSYDTAGKYFSEHYGFIPIGMNIKLVFVSGDKNTVTYCIKKVKIEDNAIIKITDNELKTGKKSQVISLINAL